MSMTDYIKRYWQAYKEKRRLTNVAEMRDTFRIKEKNGKLWIMHHDTAIFKIENCANVDDVVKILEETRDFAIEYTYGKSKQKD